MVMGAWKVLVEVCRKGKERHCERERNENDDELISALKWADLNPKPRSDDGYRCRGLSPKWPVLVLCPIPPRWLRVLLTNMCAVLLHLAIAPNLAVADKFSREKPQRPLQIFRLDVMKMAIGGGTSHVLNLIFSTAWGSETANPCVWSAIPAVGVCAVKRSDVTGSSWAWW